MGRPFKKNLPTELSDALSLIGRNIKYFREEKNLSQAELARKCKISTTRLNELESRPARDIRIATLIAISKSLDVPVISLLSKSNVDLSHRDQEILFKASEDILRITKKLR